MKICVQGLWHLGSVISACMSSVGHDVIGLDKELIVVDALNLGQAPLYEPGLNDLLKKSISLKRLRFTTDIKEALKDVEVLWIAYDTPVNDDDCADIDFVLNHIKYSLPFLENDTIILISSQMPIGTIKKLEIFVKNNLKNKKFNFAYSPENLRLGKSLDIFLHPDRIVVGSRSDLAKFKIEKMFAPITNKIEWMLVESAEMTKHAVNTFLATSIAFANEIASICELTGADAKEVERGLKTEARIGPKAYLSPGGPWGGGTLARDIEFLVAESKSRKLKTPLLSSLKISNDEHKNWVKRKLLGQFNKLDGIKIAIWGITYKPGTDTLRRSLAVELCDWLIKNGADVHVHDPAVKQLPSQLAAKVTNHPFALNAVKGARALIIGTEWPEFRQEAKKLLSVTNTNLIVIDANRHLYEIVNSFGLRYIAVGTLL